MRQPGRPKRARLIIAVVVLAAACSDQELSTPTAPSGSPPLLMRVETEGAPATAGQMNAGPLASLSIDPSVFKGGESTRTTVTLTSPAPAGGMTVTLAADDTAVTVPASLAIAEGGTSGTFTVHTRVVPADVRVRITASAGGGSLTALMRITPDNAIASVSVTPSRIPGGESATGTVTLSSNAPSGGMIVRLDSHVTDARVPSSITIAEGKRTGTFTVQTSDVSRDTEIWITASVGRDSLSLQIRLVPSRSGSAGGTGTVTIGGVVS